MIVADLQDKRVLRKRRGRRYENEPGDYKSETTPTCRFEHNQRALATRLPAFLTGFTAPEARQSVAQGVSPGKRGVDEPAPAGAKEYDAGGLSKQNFCRPSGALSLVLRFPSTYVLG